MNAPFFVPTSTRTPLMCYAPPREKSFSCSRCLAFNALHFGRGFPQPHHSAIGVGEEGVCSHARDFLLLNDDLSSRRADFLAVAGEVVDVDVYRHVSGPRFGSLRLQNASVDTALPAGFNKPIVKFRHMLDLPAKYLFVKHRNL